MLHGRISHWKNPMRRFFLPDYNRRYWDLTSSACTSSMQGRGLNRNFHGLASRKPHHLTRTGKHLSHESFAPLNIGSRPTYYWVTPFTYCRNAPSYFWDTPLPISRMFPLYSRVISFTCRLAPFSPPWPPWSALLRLLPPVETFTPPRNRLYS